ncbi:thioredoxin [Acetobacterium bakii]|uniref:Thioredoxin n=1 Tax=Acetobacterium bakii TaxID=52689 RepID=A0A0L6U2N4_9FIRM|nr:thioredoxin [Acetobacterium bakii]KNZ42612.1 hypothetical protein AKG39_05520 [Acetobacterium bakii]
MSVLTITKENFEAEIMKSDKPVILDFWAPWCDHCKRLSPIIDEIGDELTDAKVGKVNVEEQQDLAVQFKVRGIPTLLAISDGKVMKTLVGERSKAEIIEMVKV